MNNNIHFYRDFLESYFSNLFPYDESPVPEEFYISKSDDVLLNSFKKEVDSNSFNIQIDYNNYLKSLLKKFNKIKSEFISVKPLKNKYEQKYNYKHPDLPIELKENDWVFKNKNSDNDSAEIEKIKQVFERYKIEELLENILAYIKEEINKLNPSGKKAPTITMKTEYNIDVINQISEKFCNDIFFSKDSKKVFFHHFTGKPFDVTVKKIKYLQSKRYNKPFKALLFFFIEKILSVDKLKNTIFIQVKYSFIDKKGNSIIIDRNNKGNNSTNQYKEIDNFFRQLDDTINK